jgi:hypothetical protein
LIEVLIEVLAILLEVFAILTGEAKTNELDAEVSLPTKLQFTLPVLEDPLELELLEFKLELSGELTDFKDLCEFPRRRRCSIAVAWQCFNIL